jgi:tartrate dehydratase beta subunit/fumarate hydratase class I family protein
MVVPLQGQAVMQDRATTPVVDQPKHNSQSINPTTTGKTEKMNDDVTMTESEGELLAAGRFSDYHLAKAKRLFASGNLKEAIYQAGACLSHNPHNAEARALRKQAQEKQRA